MQQRQCCPVPRRHNRGKIKLILSSWNAIYHQKRRLTSVLSSPHCVGLPLCLKVFSENTTPHQQYWANSVQKRPSSAVAIQHSESSAQRRVIDFSDDTSREHYSTFLCTYVPTPFFQATRTAIIHLYIHTILVLAVIA